MIFFGTLFATASLALIRQQVLPLSQRAGELFSAPMPGSRKLASRGRKPGQPINQKSKLHTQPGFDLEIAEVVENIVAKALASLVSEHGPAKARLAKQIHGTVSIEGDA